MVWRITDPQGNEAAKVRFDIVPYMGNSNLDLGCGPSKVWPNFVGVDNGKDADLFGVQMKPDLVVGSCERLPLFATGVVDCVFSSHLLEHIEDHKAALAEWWRLVKPGGHLILYLPHRDLYPRMGTEGANPDHRHDFAEEDIIEAMREVSATGGRFDLVVNERRDQGQEYSFLQVYRKRARAGDGPIAPDLEGENLESWKDPKPEKTVGIVRPGGHGDALFGAALAREFKAQGYQVTFYTGPVGREVVRADPAIDRLITMPNGMLSDTEMVLYFLWESRKYSRWVNLIGEVEGRLLPHPHELAYHWPASVRHARMNRNYHEAMWEMAGLEFTKLEQRFHPTMEELAWARAQKKTLFKDGKLVALVPSGSGAPKTWPHVQRFVELMHCAGVYTLVLGQPRVPVNPPDEGVACLLGEDLPIRLAMTLAQVADCVVGEETGITNAVASCDMPKVILLSHSSNENLTKHWKNTAAIEPKAIACHPCHRLHNNFEFCQKDSRTGWAACQAAVSADMVAELVFASLAGQVKAAA